MNKVTEYLNPKNIIISPGPGRPEDAGISIEIIKKLKGKIPILGICLGHQAIGLAHGSKIINAEDVYHGKTSKIIHNKLGILNEEKDRVSSDSDQLLNSHLFSFLYFQKMVLSSS